MTCPSSSATSTSPVPTRACTSRSSCSYDSSPTSPSVRYASTTSSPATVVLQHGPDDRFPHDTTLMSCPNTYWRGLRPPLGGDLRHAALHASHAGVNGARYQKVQFGEHIPALLKGLVGLAHPNRAPGSGPVEDATKSSMSLPWHDIDEAKPTSRGRSDLVGAREGRNLSGQIEVHLFSDVRTICAVLQAFRADDGTRTHDLLHGKQTL